MNPLTTFVSQFNQSNGSITSLLNATGQPTPPTIADPLALTAAEYVANLNANQQRLLDIPVEALDNLTFSQLQSLSSENQAFIQALKDGDAAFVAARFDGGRAFVEGVDPSTTMRDHIIALNPDFDFDADSGGDSGDGGTGDGGTDTPIQTPVDTPVNTIVSTIEAFEQELNGLLWTPDGAAFISPEFTVDEATGQWSATNQTGTTQSGTSLDALYAVVGEAAALSILSFIGNQQTTVDALTANGTDGSDFDAAKLAAETAAQQALAALQDLGAQLSMPNDLDLTAIEAQARDQANALTDAIENALPGLGSVLNTLNVGSRNSDPSFEVNPDGTALGSEHDDWFYLSDSNDSFDGGLGADILFGFNGADNLIGGANTDQLFGGRDNDVLSGGADDDMLIGGRGNDVLDGGTGTDTAVLNGPLDRYTLQLSDDGSITAEDRSSGGDGTDTLRDVELLSFSAGASIFEAGMLDLSIIQGITALDETQIATFVELYIAYFNRAPDALGLYFWGSAFASGTSLDEIATLFLDQDETRATYPEDATNLDFATQVYSNVLGRVPDQAGLDFWQGELDSGRVSQGAFILEVLRGAKAEPGADATAEFVELQLQDRTYLNDKTDIGTYFAVIKGLSNVDEASEAMQLYLRGDQSSIQAAIAEIDADFALADTAGSGELLLQLVGVADDPFAI